MLAEREQRPQPGLDDKVLASWNGLALAALAEGARRLERNDWLDAARGVAEFLLGPLSRDDGRLSRSWREGKVSGEGFLDDYANVAHGLLELHVATGEPRWLTEAQRLALLAVDLFHDPAYGGFFLAPTGGDELVARTKGLDDNPIPSGNSMLAHVLLRLGRIWGDDELERLGVSVLRLVAPTLAASAGCLRLDAVRARPLALAAARDRDRRPCRQSRRASGARSVRAEHGRRVRACRRRAAARGKDSRRRQAGGVRLRAVCLSGARDRPRGPPLRLISKRMTTIEQTGAEEVAWDLSDLYASGDDPRIESDFAEAEAATAAFRDRTYGKVATLSATELADAINEYERIEAIATRALYYAHMSFSTNMADPARGALVAKLGEKAASLETQLLFFGLEWAAIDDEHGRGAARGSGARPLAPLALRRSACSAPTC